MGRKDISEASATVSQEIYSQSQNINKLENAFVKHYVPAKSLTKTGVFYTKSIDGHHSEVN